MIGPGIVVAATGIGAGDLIAAAKCGSLYGQQLVWAAVAGALLKFALTDGIARWQLATGTTVIEGWAERLGRPALAIVLVYLVVWTVLVGAALMSACGLAVHALWPAVGRRPGAVAHALVALGLVWSGRYATVERLMKLFIALIFGAFLAALVLAPPPPADLVGGLLPVAPAGALPYALAVLGGVGGTVTLLSYGYWMAEKGWRGPEWSPVVRVDLAVAYLLTGIFGVAVMALAGDVLFTAGLEVQGDGAVLTMARMLIDRAGAPGRAIFLAGFWGAVASSLLGVWQGVPYLFADLAGRLRCRPPALDTRSPVYRGYLVGMTLVPMCFLFIEPVGLVILYAALGALFMPFLAGSLLVMLNRRRWMGGVRNGWGSNLLLVMSVVVFLYLGLEKLLHR